MRNILPLVVGLALATALNAQEYGLREHLDRQEGVRELTPVSRESLVQLLGVEVGMTTTVGSGSMLSLRLPRLPTRIPTHVEVYDPGRDYFMIPKPDHIQNSTELFRWSKSAYVEPLGIQVQSLRVLASDETRTIFYPAYISATGSGLSDASPGYRFYFDAPGELRVFCSVVRQSSEGESFKIVELEPVHEPFGGTFSIEWDGTDAEGDRVPTGVYDLVLNGTLLLDQTREIAHHVEFFHY